MNEIIQLGEFNGVTIDARPSDQYINATAMCKATGKQWAAYWRNDATQEFISALAEQLRCENSHLAISVRGGDAQSQGTWVHRRVAIDLARWCSPEFAVMVNGWIDDVLLKGGVIAHREHSEAKMTEFMGTIAGAVVGINENLRELRHGQDGMRQDVNGIRSDVARLDDRVSRIEKRKELSEKTRRIHVQTVKRYFSGRCPCCHQTQILDAAGNRLSEGEFDHFKSRSEAAPSHTWLICSDCNSELRDGDKRRDAKVFFDAYQKRRMQTEQGDQRFLFGDSA